MRIFKNRGDIYFSKTNKERSTEQKFLIISLAIIVIFTIVFLSAVAIKFDFSAKKFFEPDNLVITQDNTIEEEVLPQVSGKNNYAVMISKDENLLFAYLVQVDLDNMSYKLSVLKESTLVEGRSLGDIYKASGAENTKIAVESLMKTDFDYYIAFERDKFVDIFDDFGDVNYSLVESVKYKDNNNAVPYSIRVREGNQDINGNQAVDLVRYYIDNNKISFANDLLLSCLTQQNNSVNFDKKDILFQKFIESSTTNITVKDFSKSEDRLIVLSSERAGISAYNAPFEYKNDKIKKDSLNEVKGYFVK